MCMCHFPFFRLCEEWSGDGKREGDRTTISENVGIFSSWQRLFAVVSAI